MQSSCSCDGQEGDGPEVTGRSEGIGRVEYIDIYVLRKNVNIQGVVGFFSKNSRKFATFLSAAIGCTKMLPANRSDCTLLIR